MLSGDRGRPVVARRAELPRCRGFRRLLGTPRAAYAVAVADACLAPLAQVSILAFRVAGVAGPRHRLAHSLLRRTHALPAAGSGNRRSRLRGFGCREPAFDSFERQDYIRTA